MSEVTTLDESAARYDEAGEGDFNIEEEVEASTHISLKRITLLREILVTQMNHLALFPLMAAVFCAIWEYPSKIEYLWLLIGPVSFAFYFLRVNIKNFFVLLAAHMAVIWAVSFLFSGVGGASFYCLACVGYGIYSFILRMRSLDFQDGRIPMPLAAGIAAFSFYFINYILSDIDLELPIIMAFILSFGLSLLVTYLESYINFLIVNRSSTGHIPAREIFFSGSFMAVICVLLMMLLLLSTSGIGWLQVILSGIGRVVSAVLRVIFSLIGPDEHGIYVDDSHIDSGTVTEIQQGEPALIWNILTVLATIALAAAAVWMAICIVKRAYAFIREQMAYKGIPSDDNELGSITDVREKCKTVARTGSPESPLFKNLLKRLSNAEKIRRLYKKSVLKYSEVIARSKNPRGESVPDKPERMTAGEWGSVLNKPDIAKIYDKARYSDSECTPEDYRLMKQIIAEKDS